MLIKLDKVIHMAMMKLVAEEIDVAEMYSLLRVVKRAKELGVPVVINPDAHSVKGLGDIDYGVMIARKGWLERNDILNSLTAEEMSGRLMG